MGITNRIDKGFYVGTQSFSFCLNKTIKMETSEQLATSLATYLPNWQ